MYTVFCMCKRVTAHTPRRFGLFVWRKRITNRESAAAEYRKNTRARIGRGTARCVPCRSNQLSR